jgi:hypothetical protein
LPAAPSVHAKADHPRSHRMSTGLLSPAADSAQPLASVKFLATNSLQAPATHSGSHLKLSGCIWRKAAALV